MTFGCNVKRGKKNFVYEPNLKYQSSMLYGYEEVYWSQSVWVQIQDLLLILSTSPGLFMPLFLHTKLRVIIVHMESLYKIIRKSN